MVGRRRRTLPPGRPGSTIRAAGLNGRVRDGNGCVPRAMAADNPAVGVWDRAEHFVVGGWRSGRQLERPGSLDRSRERSPGRDPYERSLQIRPAQRGAGQASRAISTARLSMLPCLHLPPIDVLVSDGPSESLRSGSARLGEGFPLRCFQRFSRPNIATRRCRGHDSRYTRGRFVPVLSY